jgi:Mg2+ and Co2+ transporter CorA
MQINFEKAHKLIDGLEEKLKATVGHTGKAREVLEELRKNGEERLRSKTAEALKLVRKKADSFVKSLTELEGSLAKSLEKVSAAIESPEAVKKAAKAKSATKAPSKKAPAKKAVKKPAPTKKK